MKYTHIEALVPQGEHFDESAILNEGGYLSTAHLAAIENDLATNGPALEQVNAMIDTHVATIDELNGNITTLQTEKEAAEALTVTQNAKITELQNQVTELSKAPSSRSGSTVKTNADGTQEPEKKDNQRPRFDSPDHPANQMANAIVKQQSK